MWFNEYIDGNITFGGTVEDRYQIVDGFFVNVLLVQKHTPHRDRNLGDIKSITRKKRDIAFHLAKVPHTNEEERSFVLPESALTDLDRPRFVAVHRLLTRPASKNVLCFL